MLNRRLLPAPFILTVFCAACGNDTTQTNQAAPATEPTAVATPAAPATARPNPPVDARADSTATLTVPAGDSTAVLPGKIQRLNQTIIVRVPVQNKRKLTATLLTTGGQSNVRFKQVIDPAGKEDGPFGQTVSVLTPRNGQYQLLIGHNLMSEGRAVQEFTLRVTLTQ